MIQFELFNDKVKIAVDTEFMLRCIKKEIRFVKLKHINYMRVGGGSDINMINAYNEYISILYSYGFIGKTKSIILRFTFLFKTPLILFRNSKIFNRVLIHIKDVKQINIWREYNKRLLGIISTETPHG